MKIRYLSQGNNLLGEISHTDFNEVLVPFYEPAQPDSFIFRSFTNDSHSIWKVDNIGVIGQDLEINLSKAKHATSVGTLAKQGNKTPNALVTQFNIVEVDFGHKVSSFNSTGELNDNTNCPSTHLPSELYKRRPCIVLSVIGDRIQVIPLTTSSSKSDPESIQISEQSFKHLHKKYTETACWTLPRMIQTVSSYRVFPPMLPCTSFPTTCFKYKLTSGDKSSLKEKLATHFSKHLVTEHNVLKNTTELLKKEKSALFSTNEELKQSNKELSQEILQLNDLIDKVGEEFDLKGTPEAILKGLLEKP